MERPNQYQSLNFEIGSCFEVTGSTYIYNAKHGGIINLDIGTKFIIDRFLHDGLIARIFVWGEVCYLRINAGNHIKPI